MTRVLIVDDKEENCYYLRALLSGHGYETESARHGAEALAKARQTPPDLVISDLLMPVMDGYTLLRHWKADDRLNKVPFVVYTATYTEPEDELLALNLGADAFVLKPTEPDAFLARVKQVEARAVVQPSISDVETAEVVQHQYSEVLIRKLEEKSLLLEEANRALQQDIIARERAELALRASEAKLRENEEQLRQAQKMEAIGQLAGGVAHDFNNLLSVILSYSQMTEHGLTPEDPLRGNVEEISKAAKRAGELTKQLLAFSRRQRLVPRVLQLGQVVDGLHGMLGRVLGTDVVLSLRAAPNAGRVLIDPSQIEQVVLNLVVNARHAMPQGGELSIEVDDANLDEQYAATHPGVNLGSYVRLSVRDTGVGMDAATCARIFEPFFTTKEQGRGTGLGLSTVWGIVTQSRGHISVASELGRGTTFELYFPRVDDDADVLPMTSEVARIAGGTETILLVEDEEQVRALMRSILCAQGYTVLEAANGGEALLVCEQHRGRIDMLLSDVVMPRMNGRDLAARLSPLRPDMKVLLVSGYDEASVKQQGEVLTAELPFLAKPITPDMLLRKVREVLDSR